MSSNTLDLGSLTQWYRSDADWFAFLGRYTFHGFHWRVRRDHNAEWAEDIERLRALEENRIAKENG